jgi:hypothetical protein
MLLDTKALAEATATIVREHVERATAPLIRRIADLETREAPPAPDVDAAIESALANLPTPQDGKDADPEAVAQLVREAVRAEVANLPRATDGKSVTVDDVTPLISEQVAQAVAALPVAKDGVGIAGALIDRTGALVVTLSDGTTRDLGPVVGKDADQLALEQMVRDEIAAIPRPRDGIDGFGFDDLTFEHDGERGFKLLFVKGERTKEFTFEVPVVLDRGVWREGQYKKGDATTWAGSLWIAQRDTDSKPDSGDGWRLAVKRGRDGKDKS